MNTAHVHIQHHGALFECKCTDCTSGVLANTRKCAQFGIGTRNASAMQRNHLRCGLMHPQCSSWITESVPSAEYIRGFCRGECSGIRPSLHPRPPNRCDALNLRLLRHDFAHVHAPRRCTRRAPWEIATRLFVPGKQGDGDSIHARMMLLTCTREQAPLESRLSTSPTRRAARPPASNRAAASRLRLHR